MKKKNEPYTCPVDVFPATPENAHYVGYTLEEKPGVLLGMKVVNKSPNDLPTKATEGSAAMDVRAWCINEAFQGDGADWDEESKCVRIFSGGRALIHTGLYFEIPKGYVMDVRPRSGLALKNGVTVLNTPGTIDAKIKINLQSLEYLIKN